MSCARGVSVARRSSCHGGGLQRLSVHRCNANRIGVRMGCNVHRSSNGSGNIQQNGGVTSRRGCVATKATPEMEEQEEESLNNSNNLRCTGFFEKGPRLYHFFEIC